MQGIRELLTVKNPFLRYTRSRCLERAPGCCRWSFSPRRAHGQPRPLQSIETAVYRRDWFLTVSSSRFPASPAPRRCAQNVHLPIPVHLVELQPRQEEGTKSSHRPGPRRRCPFVLLPTHWPGHAGCLPGEVQKDEQRSWPGTYFPGSWRSRGFPRRRGRDSASPILARPLAASDRTPKSS